MKHSVHTTKYIEIGALKLNKNSIEIEKDVAFIEIFYIMHASMTAKKGFQNFIHYST